jgi:hypothetical protein
VVALVVSSCGCIELDSRAVTEDRAFRVEVQTVGNCISTVNTVVKDVEVFDLRGWYTRKHLVFRIGVARAVSAKWIDNSHLEISYVPTGVVPVRIHIQTRSWGGINISYREVVADKKL